MLAEKRTRTVVLVTATMALVVFLLAGCGSVPKSSSSEPAPSTTAPSPTVPSSIIYTKSSHISGYDKNDGKPFVVHNAKDLVNIVGDSPRVFDADKQALDGTAALLEIFDDEFFDENDLLCAHYDAGSGSYGVSVVDVKQTGNGYEVEFATTKPGGGLMGTCDTAYWTALIPIEKTEQTTQD